MDPLVKPEDDAVGVQDDAVGVQDDAVGFLHATDSICAIIYIGQPCSRRV